jgi:hypothetical protein
VVKTEKFLISQVPVAVDLASYRVLDQHPTRTWAQLQAVWYRRRKGVTIVSAGVLPIHVDGRPADVYEALDLYEDNGFGTDCRARWDGKTLWGQADEPTRAGYLALLRPMLDSYPVIPAGFDGWWAFRARLKRG